MRACVAANQYHARRAKQSGCVYLELVCDVGGAEVEGSANEALEADRADASHRLLPIPGDERHRRQQPEGCCICLRVYECET